jgi:hypothetical protein
VGPLVEFGLGWVEVLDLVGDGSSWMGLTAAMRRPEGDIEAWCRRSFRTSLVVLYSWTVVA